MKILVERLTATPDAHSFEADSAWWQAGGPAQRGLPRELPGPLRLEVRTQRFGEDIYLEGQLEGALELECSRCLARYRHRLREHFRLVLEPAGERTPADPEGAAALARDGVFLGDDFETGWFRGKEIHLGSFALEMFALALPVKPLCEEDCPGLCPHCGVELKSGPCGCSETRADSPFAALAALRDRPRQGED
jgi:uncharacterized protein